MKDINTSKQDFKRGFNFLISHHDCERFMLLEIGSSQLVLLVQLEGGFIETCVDEAKYAVKSSKKYHEHEHMNMRHWCFSAVQSID